jgi:hypothetical protein
MKQKTYTPEHLINQIHDEEKKYREIIKNDKVLEEAREIKLKIKRLKEELIKLFPGREDKIDGKQ